MKSKGPLKTLGREMKGKKVPAETDLINGPHDDAEPEAVEEEGGQAEEDVEEADDDEEDEPEPDDEVHLLVDDVLR